jgi:glutamate synthase domain-containing protein 2
MQIGTAKYGVRDAGLAVGGAPARTGRARNGARLRDQAVAGRQAGQGRRAARQQGDAEIARIRGIPQGQDSISPNRHRDIANIDDCSTASRRCAMLTGKPVGIKTALGGWQDFMNELTKPRSPGAACRRARFHAIDGGEGGSGAAPQALADHMALSIDEALPRVVDALIEAGLRERMKVIAAGKLVTSARAPGRCRPVPISSIRRAASCSRSAASRPCAAIRIPVRPASPRTTRACNAVWWSRTRRRAWPTTAGT